MIDILKALPVPVVEEKPSIIPAPIEKVVEKAKDAVVVVREIEKVNNLPDYSLVFILMLVIIILLILLIIYGIYYFNKFKNYIKRKLKNTEEDVEKKFRILEDDIYKEAVISKKLKENQKLNEEELTALVDFKQDIKNTEKEIIDEIKGIEENN